MGNKSRGYKGSKTMEIYFSWLNPADIVTVLQTLGHLGISEMFISYLNLKHQVEVLRPLHVVNFAFKTILTHLNCFFQETVTE